MVRKVAGHPAVLGYVIGNEIPAAIVRWHGRKRVERFLKRLYLAVKKEDEGAMVTYVNYPTTEYLQLPFLDFFCFNVYLEDQNRLEGYLYRLQNIAGERPLVLGELGLDSRRNGDLGQARLLDRQIRTAFGAGCTGVFVFAWTDEWFRGGVEVTDWDFGLTNRHRRPKPALRAVRRAFADVPFPPAGPWPRISVIVCTYNGNRTIAECCRAIKKLDYPNLEVIIVDDGSTDGTHKAIRRNGFRLIRTPNVGLSAARNLGLEAAEGEIVAYIDDDAYPDPDWLKYLAAAFLTTDCAGAGGPNISPPGDGKTAACVANAPGGPLHVLMSDRSAEHLPGCNMAFRKVRLKAVGGFDPRFRTAGDDVDLCWRIQEQGWWLAFSPGAMVWHHRRNSIRAYIRQQKGYGRAEAILEQKWPGKYNSLGHLDWKGRIYGRGLTRAIGWRKWRIYQGIWGSAPFQSLYGPAAGMLESWPVMPEWYLLNAILLTLGLAGILWKPLLLAFPLLMLTAGLSLMAIFKSGVTGSATDRPQTAPAGLKAMALTALLHAIQPLARLYGRFSSGLTPWRRRGSGRFRLPLPRAYAIWSERWRSAAHWLESIEKALKCQGAIVRRGGEFDYWDLEIRGGLSGSCRCQIAIEEHGSGTQLIRLRVRPKISVPAVTMTCVFGLLSALALADHAVAGSVMLGLAALVLGLHSLIDCAAAKSACHEAIGGIVQAADREASDISAGRNDQRQAVPQPDSKFDFADIEARSDFPSLPQRPVQKSEPLQQ